MTKNQNMNFKGFIYPLCDRVLPQFEFEVINSNPCTTDEICFQSNFSWYKKLTRSIYQITRVTNADSFRTFTTFFEAVYILKVSLHVSALIMFMKYVN